MANYKIAVLDEEDILKFNGLYYDELLLELPEDALVLGSICTDNDVPEPAGLLISHIREKAVFVDWLYVDEAHRGKGVARDLVDYIKEAVIQAEEAGIDVIFINFPETIRGMGKFLKDNDFAVTFFDGNFNIYAPLKSVRLMRGGAPKPSRLVAVPLDQVPRESFDNFDNYLEMVENAYEGVISPINPGFFRPESRAILDGDRIVGIMLVGNTIYEDNVMIDWVYSIPKYVIEAVPLAFDTVITELRKNVPAETKLSMASLSANVGSIIRKTMPGAVFQEAYSAFWVK